MKHQEFQFTKHLQMKRSSFIVSPLKPKTKNIYKSLDTIVLIKLINIPVVGGFYGQTIEEIC